MGRHILAIAIISGALHAHSLLGTISGTIVDSPAAVIPPGQQTKILLAGYLSPIDTNQARSNQLGLHFKF